jgi:hypothetical protein
MLGCFLVLVVGVFGVCFRNSVSPTKFAVVFTYTLQTTFLLCELTKRGVWLEKGSSWLFPSPCSRVTYDLSAVTEMNSCERVRFCHFRFIFCPG